MVSVFDGCDDSCGWVAAFVAALAYGSFGVPIKATVKIDVHPLVFQSYKTGVMFLMSWGVMLLGVSPSWTPWGLLSGFLWVVGGTGGIYGIRMAGLAIAVGTWASVMIGVNFVWGILIFQEPVHNIWSTIGAFSLLAFGLVGMSHFSAPEKQMQSSTEDGNNDGQQLSPTSNNNNTPYGVHNKMDVEDRNLIDSGQGQQGQYQTPFSMLTEDKKEEEPQTTVLCGYIMSKRKAGILGAVFNGLMTGSSLIPLHYAEQEGFGGARYMISFATGALMSNCIIWVAFFGLNYVKTMQQDLSGSMLWQAYEGMPLWHVQQLWLPASIAGFLLTIAMFGSILSVTYLGQGVGNSLVQSKILVRYVRFRESLSPHTLLASKLYLTLPCISPLRVSSTRVQWPVGHLLV